MATLGVGNLKKAAAQNHHASFEVWFQPRAKKEK